MAIASQFAQSLRAGGEQFAALRQPHARNRRAIERLDFVRFEYALQISPQPIRGRDPVGWRPAGNTHAIHAGPQRRHARAC
ncbi:MAG: hypothetical protein WDN04_05585 [Rhodospirillales bacterium]